MRVAGVTLLAALTLGAALPAREPTKQELLAAVEKQLKTAAETAGPCVGLVVVSKSDRYPKPIGAAEQPGKLGGYDLKEFLKLNPAPGDARVGISLDLSDPKNLSDHGYACGVVIDPSGLVLTPYHVVEGATKVYVYLPGKAGSYADIHAADARHDLAVLKLISPPAQLTAIKFADVRVETRAGQRPNLATGKLVVLMANVYLTGFVIDKPSAALGSVTDIRSPRLKVTNPREQKPERHSSYYYYGPLIEHDTLSKLNTGVDGAALLNLDGELVGLTTSSAVVPGERGAYYALPADGNFRRVLDVLRRGEEVDYGYLGVTLPATDGEVLQITDVVPFGPADLAGIRGSNQTDRADIITHVNDIPITCYEELLQQVGAALAGNKVKLTVERMGRSRPVEITLGKFLHGQPYIASVRPDPVFGLRVDYGSILAQTPPRTAGGVPSGVCVRELAPNSPAAAAFKKLGDEKRWLITHVNGVAVSTPAEFYKTAKGQASIKLTVKDPSEPNPRDREVSFP